MTTHVLLYTARWMLIREANGSHFLHVAFEPTDYTLTGNTSSNRAQHDLAATISLLVD